MAAQFTFDEGLVLPRGLSVVDGAGDQLLAGARLAGDQHGGVGPRHLTHFGERAQDRRGLADDVAERGLRPDLLLEVEILLLEARLEGRDLLVSQHVLDGERHLLGDRREQRRLPLAVPTGHAAPDVERSDNPPLAREGDRDRGAKPLLEQRTVLDERGSIPQVHREYRLAMIEDPAGAARGAAATRCRAE